MGDILMKWNWTQFCGQGDDLVVWDSSHGDFGRCFEVIGLQFPSLAVLAIVSAYYCGMQTDWVVRLASERAVLRVRCLSCLLLLLVPVACVMYQVSYSAAPLLPAHYFVAAAQCLAWAVHLVFVLALRHRLGRSLRGPPLVAAVWLANCTALFLRCRSLYTRSEDEVMNAPAQMGFLSAQLALHCVYGLTLIPSGHLSAERDSSYQTLFNVQQQESYGRFREELDPGYVGVAGGGDGWGVLARLLFSWAGPLLGAGGRLRTPDSLFELPPSLKAAGLAARLDRALARCRLIGALHRCFWKEFYGIGILKFIADVSGFFGPLLLNRLVTFIQTKNENVEYGYFYAGGLCTVSLIGALCNSHFNWLMSKVGLKIRGALVCVVYKKTLSLSTISLSAFSTGEIINFMSVDTDRVVNSCASFHSCWSIPFQIAVTLYLLHQQVGLAFLAGVGFTLALIPVNKCIASQIGKLSTKLMSRKDERVKLTLSVLRGIKTVKLHVWEDHFIDKISGVRSEELRYLKGRKYLDALCVYFWATTPVVISILTFSVYTLRGNRLDAATVFTCIALLNMLISPLNAFPWVLNGLTEAWVSLGRIQRMLLIDDLDVGEFYGPLPSVVDPTPRDDGSESDADGGGEAVIAVSGAHFDWGPGQFQLRDIHFIALKGQFIGVFGPVGCGKSSLLCALLAEMNKSAGFVGIPNVKHGFAYVSQTPWLRRGTIRDNILFGKPFDQTKYKAVLHACALVHDLAALPGGDLALVGEAGAALSGGQRVRVALARAVYQDRNVYLLDAVLSAVDVRTARHILRHCLGSEGLLADRTRILCTHHTRHLLRADSVVSMAHGTIIKQGPPSEVLPDYEEMVTTAQLEVGGEREPASAERPRTPTPSLPLAAIPGEEEETREEGRLAGRVYNAYLRAVGYLLTVGILTAVTLMQVSRNGADWWMSYWVTHSQNATSVQMLFDRLQFPTIASGLDPSTRYYLTVYALIAVCNSVFTLARAFLFAYGGLRAAAKMHRLLLDKVVRAKFVHYDILPLGQILNRLSSDVYTIDDSLPFIANILLAQLFAVVGTVCVMVWSVPQLCLVLLPLVPLYHRLQSRYRPTARDLKRLGSLTLSPLYNHFTETLQGLVTIRALRSVPNFRWTNDSRLEDSQRAQLASAGVAQWLAVRLQLMGVLVVTGVATIAALRHHMDVADPGLVGLAVSYALSVTGALSGLINAFTETEREMVSVERVDQYLRRIDTEEEEGAATASAPPPYWLSQGVICFNSVTLKYRDHLAASLVGVSFETRPNERVGVVGRTGAGKSSLLAALFRLVELADGEILIDSVNIAHIGLVQLRSRLAIIPQEAALFGGTARESVDPLGQYADGAIWTALHRCHLAPHVVRRLDAKLPPLSHGQAQLLCLARAVLHNAKIVCIDEATASVDESTDRLIQQTLRASFRHSTVITVAHRVGTVMDCDRVLVMGDGAVLEFDTPDNLLRDHNSHFYQLLHRDDSS